jgi:hypothetical protein
VAGVVWTSDSLSTTDSVGGGRYRINSNGGKFKEEWNRQLYPKVIAGVYSSQSFCRRSTYPRSELMIVMLNLSTWPLVCGW